MDIRIKFILILIAIPIFITLWPSFLGGDTDFMIVYGTSMLPTIEPGSMIITKAQESYQVDDIVSYTMKDARGIDKNIVHRIIEENEYGYIIQGDNNPKVDRGPGPHKEVPLDYLTGNVIFATPYVGFALGFVKNPVMMALIGVVSLAFRASKKKSNPKSSQDKNKTKKLDFKFFYIAMAVNGIAYAFAQYSLSIGFSPTTDVLTNFFLSTSLVPTFALTFSAAIYFLFIFGIYYMAKTYKPKPKSTGSQSRALRLLIEDQSNPMLVGAQLLWLLFILTLLLPMMNAIQELGMLDEFFEMISKITL